MNLESRCAALLLLLASAAAFSPYPPTTTPRHSLTQRFYRDDKSGSESGTETQSSSIAPSRLPNSPTRSTSSSWKRTDQLWNQEWHDAFIRSGLIDFTPPMTDHLFCLMVGDGLGETTEKENKLPWEPPKALEGGEKKLRASSVLLHNDQSCGEPGNMFGDRNTRIQFRYDCILDTSWMNDLAQKENFGHSNFVSSRPTIDALLKNAGTLLAAATQALQEHGIYVAITQKPMASTPILQEYLVHAGASLGMQWHFDLEEISGGNVYVSVARTYFTGTLPASHGLAITDLEPENGEYPNRSIASSSSSN